MNAKKTFHAATILLLSGLPLGGCTDDPAAANELDGAGFAASRGAAARTIPVSGSAVHFFSTAIVHSQESTATGMIQRSTDIIRLTGDVNGYVLYHPTSNIDNQSGTLVNTGTQIFSGTVAGSEPVILHDDRFRFDVDLNSGATTGNVYLSRSNDAPNRGGWYECHLVVVGTGVTPEGDNLSDYSGECVARGNQR